MLWLPNGLELSCPAEAGRPSLIVEHAGGRGAPPFAPARRVSFSELLGGPTHGPRASLARVDTPEKVVVLGDEIL
jgi:hypothetical protein